MAKTMNAEARESLNDVIQKMTKEAQTKRKQAEDMLIAAKILEETIQKLSKELDSIQTDDGSAN
jgi:uncharacterized protein YoxC